MCLPSPVSGKLAGAMRGAFVLFCRLNQLSIGALTAREVDRFFTTCYCFVVQAFLHDVVLLSKGLLCKFRGFGLVLWSQPSYERFCCLGSGPKWWRCFSVKVVFQVYGSVSIRLM
ncbi:hypothetical protein F2Q70_00018174 [Brassica cretica]|uniref:Uncharacterized protein n=1 Tax=Brassica cretica TaxID=69181 RepID=A0A8S9L4H3_BRACR|nr:hypothetical protein F2Q70_00018174 [Brassica cretica]KAF2601011.1 hypothetical protein F2Q68_00011284 [Brassica cretica]